MNRRALDDSLALVLNKPKQNKTDLRLDYVVMEERMQKGFEEAY
jgi:hypothetical protein